MISRFSDTPWSSCSPDMSPLNYWFWSVCLVELRRAPPPTTLEKMIDSVEEFKNSLDEQEIRGACRSILRRAQACIEARGGAFEYKEYKMKKAERAIEE